MPWMTDADRARLGAELEEDLREEVELSVRAGEDAGSARAVGVLRELAELSPKIRLRRIAGTGLVPSIEIRGKARGRLGFLGLSTGYEFPTLVDAIRDASRGETSLDPSVRSRLGELETRRRLRVFTTPT